MERLKKLLLTTPLLLALLCFLITGCSSTPSNVEELQLQTSSQDTFSLSEVEPYNGEAFTMVNDNIPYFNVENIDDEAFEYYAPLDSLERCTGAVALVGKETMPTKKRGNISQVKPTGWQSITYDHVDGKHLYNRCHLIGFQLTGEDANKENLITGTRYLNVEGMLPFENMIADYVKETNNHVLYRVTPIFEEDNLVASGVLLEAYSLEDQGDGIEFCVYAYNVQPMVTINYKDGTSHETKANQTSKKEYYIINTNTKTFHRASCPSAQDITKQNKKTYRGDKKALLSQGYKACKRCKP